MQSRPISFFAALGVAVLLGHGTAAAADAEISLGSPVRSSEMRTFFPVVDGNRRYLAADVQDYAERGYLLLTDLETGRTRKLENPPEVLQDDSFGALVTRDKHFFYSQGGVVLSCDLRTGQWRKWGRIDRDTQYYFAFAEGPDGRIWCGGFPQSKLLAIDRSTGKVTDYGRLDPKEAYLTHLAFDDRGFLYGAIAQARRDLVCFRPETGEKRSLLPESLRKNGRLHLFRGTDGAIYARVDGRIARMFDGRLEFVDAAAPADPAAQNSTYLFVRNKSFPDGTEVLLYDTENRRVTLRSPRGDLRHLELPPHSNGTKLSGKTLAADGKLYLSSGHPMHLAVADLKSGALRDFGPIPYIAGGTFSVMRTAPDGRIYGGQYAGGGLWVFDPAREWLHPGISQPLFGAGDPMELAQSFVSAPGSRCVRLVQPDVVLFVGGGNHTRKFAVPTPGRYFINLMFLRAPQYGALEIEVDGRRCERLDTHSETVDFTPVVSCPVELTAGEHTLVLRSAAPPQLFGMVGFEIGPVNRANFWNHRLHFNPRNLGLWQDESGQPRGMVISPDNRTLLMGGLAGYGLAGGKLIEYDIPSGRAVVVDALAPGESVERLEWLDADQVLIATTIRAQGGGHVTARSAAVKRYDVKTRKIVAACEFANERLIGSALPWQGRIAALGGKNRLYLLDPETLALRHTIDLGKLGYLTVTFTPMLTAPDGRLFLIASRGLWELASPDAEPRLILASPSRRITSGAAYFDGRLYFIRSHELCAIPAAPR